MGVCVYVYVRVKRDSGSFAAILFMCWFADNGNCARYMPTQWKDRLQQTINSSYVCICFIVYNILYINIYMFFCLVFMWTVLF